MPPARRTRRWPPFGKACLDRELVPLILGNRIHVAPPLNVSEADAADGLAILDEALAAADGFVLD